MLDPLRFAPPLLDDLSALLAVERAAYPLPWSERMLREEILHPLSFSRVAWEGPDPVGYLFARQIFEDLHITNIAVRPERRREGIARRLLADCLERARGEGILRALLECREKNRAAIGLYLDFQFEEVGRRPGYYVDTGEDAILFTRKIGVR